MRMATTMTITMTMMTMMMMMRMMLMLVMVLMMALLMLLLMMMPAVSNYGMFVTITQILLMKKNPRPTLKMALRDSADDALNDDVTFAMTTMLMMIRRAVETTIVTKMVIMSKIVCHHRHEH